MLVGSVSAGAQKSFILKKLTPVDQVLRPVEGIARPMTLDLVGPRRRARLAARLSI